jgi:hypothetical protein
MTGKFETVTVTVVPPDIEPWAGEMATTELPVGLS